jgi:hypothetical protein
VVSKLDGALTLHPSCEFNHQSAVFSGDGKRKAATTKRGGTGLNWLHGKKKERECRAGMCLLIVFLFCFSFVFSTVGGGGVGVGGGVMPGSEYSYTSHHYSQYAPSPYGSYGYSAGTGGLLTK